MLNRELTPNYLLQVVRRRKLSILFPAVIITALAMIYALLLPSIYLSETQILVEPQQSVQTTAGKPSITVTMEREGLATLSQQILSRSNLEQIITEHGLYGSFPMEQRVRNMRDDIQIDVVRTDQTGNVSGFKLAYQNREPRMAAKVTNRLAGLFIEVNTGSREKLLNEKLTFLEDQTAQAKVNLGNQEQRLQEFKQKYFERMPEQRDKNLKMVEQLSTQLSANNDALNRAQQQRVYIEAMLAQYQSAPATVRAAKTSAAAITELPLTKTPTAIEKELEETKIELAELRNKYTAEHPDVIRVSRSAAELERKRKAELEQEALNKSKRAAEQEQKRKSEQEQKRAVGENAANSQSSDAQIGSDAVSPENFATVAQLTSQLKSIRAEVQDRNAETSRLKSQLNLYQSLLEIPPSVEQELVRLTRDYNSAKENYETLANEMGSAQMAQDLENKQKGMLFRILDPAKEPEKPYKPNRRAIAMFGLLLGLASGLGLAFYREFSDESLHTEKDVETALRLEVLATIPKV